MRYIELLQFADLVTSDSWSRLRKYGRPDKVGNTHTPADLYGLTFGELVQAQKHAQENDIKGLISVLLGMSDTDIKNSDASEVMAFAYWSSRELERIGQLFVGLNAEPTPEQLKAGIKNLNHGLFGTLDWYCRRMGITDHSEAENVPWVRIYKCMKIDSDNNKFETKLRQVYEQQRKQQQCKR